MDDNSISAKFHNDQRREALVVDGWWVVFLISKRGNVPL